MIIVITTSAIILQALILILLALDFFSGRKVFKNIVPIFLLLAGLLLLGTLIYRSLRIEFWAITNTYESLLFFSCMVMFILFGFRLRTKKREILPILFGGTLFALVLLALSTSPIADSRLEPPIPALQSGWLALHVSLAFIGEAFFVVAFVSSILYLTSKDEEQKKAMDKLTYKSIAVGYPIFTAGAIIFGAVWAYYAWGRFWGWDPKETWALITWLTYTVYLHVRFIAKLDKRITAVVSIVGFLFTLFTFFGVNFLLSGLHSYG